MAPRLTQDEALKVIAMLRDIRAMLSDPILSYDDPASTLVRIAWCDLIGRLESQAGLDEGGTDDLLPDEMLRAARKRKP